MDLSDFIQPLIIEKAEDFKPRAAKALFERTCHMLSQQAFWLSIFEYLQKHKDSVEGVQFLTDQDKWERHQGVADCMTPVARLGANPDLLAKAHSASTGAFSKARGKIPKLDIYSLKHLATQCLPASGIATLEMREHIMQRALGADLYGLRLATIESKELDSTTSQSVAAALSGRKNRL
jgi:hypothetical protein